MGASPDLNNVEEQARLAGLHWVHLDGAARMLESTRSTVFAQIVSGIINDYSAKGEKIPMNKAEIEARNSKNWTDFNYQMNKARTAANEARVEKQFKENMVSRWQAENANARAEMRLNGTHA